jgi:hypothetical protein
VLSLPHQGSSEDWDGLIQGRPPGPWTPGNGLVRWKVRVNTLKAGEKWPSGQEHSDFIFSSRNVNACINHNRCAIGLTVLTPSNRLSINGNTPFPIAIAHRLAPSSPEGNTGRMEYKARYSYTINIDLLPGFNTIAWSGHAPILFKQGVYHTMQPTISFPGTADSSYSTFSLNHLGEYSLSHDVMPIPYDVEGGPAPVHYSIYNPEGRVPALQMLSLAGLGSVYFSAEDLSGGLQVPKEFNSHTHHWLHLVFPD